MASMWRRLLRQKDGQQSATAASLLFRAAGSAASAGHLLEAVRLYEQLIVVDPGDAEAHYKLGNALKDLGRITAAIASYSAAVAINPGHSFALCNRGTLQHRHGLLADALESYDLAISIDPADEMSHYNRALLLQDLRRPQEAVASYNRAIAIRADFSEAQYNRALSLLYLGDYERGWRAYEWRWQNANRLQIGAKREFPQPLWLGQQSLENMRLLLHAEAGLGDTIQFSRYASLCASRGATVILEVQQPLTSLLGTLDGVSQIIAAGEKLPPFDLHCPLMSLPLAFGTTLNTVPSSDSYLHSEATATRKWLQALPASERPRIGLSWSGNRSNWIDGRRSVRLADLLEMLPTEFEYYCLQTQVRDEDTSTLRASTVTKFPDAEMDFRSTAGLCENMDAVVSVDTSIAHLAAALGRPTHLLLAMQPDWRWMRDRNDSPWYASMTLHRQSREGRWQDVFARLAAHLKHSLTK